MRSRRSRDGSRQRRRSEPENLGLGGGGCGRRREEATMEGFRGEVGTAEERRRWPAVAAGAGNGCGFFFLSFPFSSLPLVLTYVISLSENRPGGRVTVS
jgi:hypothetical protein